MSLPGIQIRRSNTASTKQISQMFLDIKGNVKVSRRTLTVALALIGNKQMIAQVDLSLKCERHQKSDRFSFLPKLFLF